MHSSRKLSVPTLLIFSLCLSILLLEQSCGQSRPALRRLRHRQRRLTHVNDETDLIRDLSQILSSDRIGVIRFYAEWCPVCQSDGPEFLKVIGKYPLSTAKFFKVDVDHHPNLVNEYGIRAVPTYFILQKGVPYVTFHSAQEVDNYLSRRKK